MPKKTKKQKLISQSRKQAFLLQQLNKLESNNINQKNENTKLFIKNDFEKELSSQDKTIKNYFKKDFKKSIFITLIIIALEIVLYFGTINKYFY